jgi:hypothetical protein
MSDSATEWKSEQEVLDRVVEAPLLAASRWFAFSLRMLSDEMRLQHRVPQLQQLEAQLQAFRELRAHMEIYVSSLRPFACDAVTRPALAKLENARRQLEEISQSLRLFGDATEPRDQAATLQPLLRQVEQLASSLSQGTAETECEDQLANLKRLLRELDALPLQNPDDGFSSRDHDEVLYREPR